jgi:plasmid segregation protein ParM
MKGVVRKVMKDYVSRLVAVDNGFFATKVSMGSECFTFRSKYEVADDNLNENNTWNLKYNDIEYLVGEGASIDNREYDKTNNELHKICTYAALAKLSNFVGTHFKVIVGYPLNLYSANKDIFKKYLMDDFKCDMLEVEFQFENKKFTIDDITVLPQGAGALYVNPERWKGKIVAIIDIGGLTVNGCIFDNLNIIRNSIFTEKLGMFSLRNEIKKALDRRFTCDLKDYELQYVIDNGLKFNGVVEPESLEIINQVKLQHVKDIRKVMIDNGYNIGFIKLFFIGGGSLQLRSQISEVFKDALFSDDCVYDNVKGFYKAGELIYGKKDF